MGGLSFLALSHPLFAQAPAARPAPVISPEIGENQQVIFRLRANNAKEVVVRGQWSTPPLPMVRGEGGLWSCLVPSVPAGIWEYSLVVDGVAMIDPGNPAIKPMRQPRSSILHVPGQPLQPWDFQDVPHGAVHQHSYRSKVLGRPRELCVYTPPGYETDRGADYPLLVLQHGSGDSEATWTAHGKAHWILDHLIAAGKARPMIVLMLNGHPFGLAAGSDPSRRGEALTAFRRELFEDALPLVEARYRVSKDAQQRGIVGLSMGGGQSLTVGLAHPDRFAWVGAFSAAMPDEAALQRALGDVDGTNAHLRLLWIAVGRTDALHVRNEELVAKLKERGVRHEWRLTEGGHAWPVWRQYLVEFLPRLFR